MRGYSFFIEQKCRIYAAFGVSQTPIFNKKEGVISASENRSLAPFPKFYNADGTFNLDYLQDVEVWFNDNLGFRDYLVEADALIKYYAFDRLNGMRLGVNGELTPFYSLADYQHTNLLDEDGLDEVTDSYQTIYDYLDSLGIQVYYIQCWDKQTIYPEQYRNTIQVLNDYSMTDQVERALLDNTDIDVVPIKETLIRLKDKYNIFGPWTEPWHWLWRGAFVGYTELITEINNENNNKYYALCENDMNIDIKDVGLTYYGYIHQTDEEEVLTLRDPHAVLRPIQYMPDESWGGHAKYFVNNSVDNEDTILVLGDSYFHDYGVIYCLAESFHTTIMFNGSAATNDHLIKIIDTYKPDIVVFENAERCNYRFSEAVGIANDITSHVL
ncbi:hypothetical protein [Butyrivibrio fibrisolvens]|uniref:hypothetical protein n=1 Tax=Butyrivibrio fibrisolvens TaxID=831 RepID=UPI0020BEFE9F|nr:hypothetical protein [Butyrivibrio fibrisolvens]